MTASKDAKVRKKWIGNFTLPMLFTSPISFTFVAIKIISLLNFSPTISIVNGERRIFDPIRRKQVAATPEELVRQEFIHFLLTEKGFPAGLMMVEYALKVNGMSRRCDILACDRAGRPLLLVECKAPGVKIGNETFEQAARYNLTLRVPYLAITNGAQTYCSHINFEADKIAYLKEFPKYEEICKQNQ